jgi:hypothetical protein
MYGIYRMSVARGMQLHQLLPMAARSWCCEAVHLLCAPDTVSLIRL